MAAPPPALLLTALLAVTLIAPGPAPGQPEDLHDPVGHARQTAHDAVAAGNAVLPGQDAPDQPTPCEDGQAGPFPCENIDLLGHLSLEELGVSFVNDIWGWTDPLTNREYALVGAIEGTVVVDVTEPSAPWVVGTLPSHSTEGRASWRDIKVHEGHAFVVAEYTDHGLQVLDLTELRLVTPAIAPLELEETAHYDGFGSAHNLAINPTTGFAYALGSDTCTTPEDERGGGPHMLDLTDPTEPTFAGCFTEHGYTHDAQCVAYHGPDLDYEGREICMNSNEQTLSIADVTDKDAPVGVADVTYEGVAYTHQGWLTPDHSFFLLGDELDEQLMGHNTRTYIWDVTDLDEPTVVGSYTHPSTASTDHNLYTEGRWVYESNYTAGLRILDAADVAGGTLSEIAFFDVYPEDDEPGFAGGTWSNYPWFRQSDLVAVSSMDRGLFLLRSHLDEEEEIVTIPLR